MATIREQVDQQATELIAELKRDGMGKAVMMEEVVSRMAKSSDPETIHVLVTAYGRLVDTPAREV